MTKREMIHLLEAMSALRDAQELAAMGRADGSNEMVNHAKRHINFALGDDVKARHNATEALLDDLQSSSGRLGCSIEAELGGLADITEIPYASCSPGRPPA